MELVKNLISSLRIPPKIKKSLSIYLYIKENWNFIMQDSAKEIEPISIEEDSLVIGVFNHYELQRLSFNYMELLKKINSSLPFSSSLKALKFIYYPKRKKEALFPSQKRFLLKEQDLALLKKECENLLEEDLKKTFFSLFKTLSQKIHKQDGY